MNDKLRLCEEGESAGEKDALTPESVVLMNR